MTSLEGLIRIIADINDTDELGSLFQEIFTERERTDLAKRWQLLQDLYDGETQRSIAARHRISLCKITRGSKILKDKNSTSLKIIKKMRGGKQ